MIFGSYKRNWNLRRSTFFSLVGLFFLDLQSACLATLGYTTNLPMVLEKKVNLRKNVFYGFVLLQNKNVLETEYLSSHTFSFPKVSMTWLGIRLKTIILNVKIKILLSPLFFQTISLTKVSKNSGIQQFHNRGEGDGKVGICLPPRFWGSVNYCAFCPHWNFRL